MAEILAFQALLIVCATAGFVAFLRFIRRMVELRQQRPGRVSADGLEERLYRIETIVETTALEVERISEANRFMAKLLAERAGEAESPGLPGRVTTPR